MIVPRINDKLLKFKNINLYRNRKNIGYENSLIKGFRLLKVILIIL